MKYPDLEKRLRKLERQAAVLNSKLHIVFVRIGENREEEIAKLGSLSPGDEILTVTFVRAADTQSPATMQ